MSWDYIQYQNGKFRTNKNGGGGGDSGHAYSTTEQVVGTWIDGKPVYEITLQWNDTTVNDYVRKDIHDLNIKTIISANGWFDRLQNNHAYWYPFNTMENSSEYGFFRVDDENGYDNGQILWRINYMATSKQVIILQYTKTTD